jgi:hypothetical protein
MFFVAAFSQPYSKLPDDAARCCRVPRPSVLRVRFLTLPFVYCASSQNRSLKYFSPESGNTVTITARWPEGSAAAT